VPQILVTNRDDFTGGLNLRADQFQLSPNESPDMLNMEVDPRGGLFTRGAYREINTTAVSGTWAPKRLTWFKAATQTLMLTTETRVYTSTGGNFSLLNFGPSAPGSPVVSASTDGASLAQWGDTMYMTTGKSGVATYSWKVADTYATALTPSSPTWQTAPATGFFPKAEHTIQHANKMFVANVNENGTLYPNRLRFSNEALPESWSDADKIDFNGGGDGITGLAVVAGHLVIFKPQAIYVLFGYDSADHQVVELSNALGCDSPMKIATSENGVYFYTHTKGLFFYNGSTVVDLFQNLNAIYPSGYINDAQTSKISVSYVNRRVWLSMPYSKLTAATVATVNFVYDPSVTASGSWVKHSSGDGYGLIGGTDFVTTSGAVNPLMIHPAIPRVLRVDVFTSQKDLLATVETSFDSNYRTGWVDGNSYSMKKMFRRPDFVLKQVDAPISLNIKVFHDYEEATGFERKDINVTLPASTSGFVWDTSVWDTATWGTTSVGAQVVRGSNLGLARSVQLLFTGPVGKKWGLDSIAFKYNNRKVTG
jgi:hypothetical protein